MLQKTLLITETQSAAVHVQLSNVYAAAGLWNDVEKGRNSMKDRGVKKEPGHTWTELGDQTRSFVVEDRVAYIFRKDMETWTD